jgi:DNA polymerase alpha/epsilon subunit B
VDHVSFSFFFSDVFGKLDYLGAPQDVYDHARLAQIEKRTRGAYIVFLSDVHLDSEDVVSALRKLLARCEAETPPMAIVMCGSFCSAPLADAPYSELWASLAGMIASFPTIANGTTFVFVPGPNDPWGPFLMPRAPLPHCLAGRHLVRRVKRAEFASNPCRIKFCTQEIVVHRHNALAKLYRNITIIPETDINPKHLPAHVRIDKNQNQKKIYRYVLAKIGLKKPKSVRQDNCASVTPVPIAFACESSNVGLRTFTLVISVARRGGQCGFS